MPPANILEWPLFYPIKKTTNPRFWIKRLPGPFANKIIYRVKHFSMKLFILLSLSTIGYACFPGREVQAEMVYATLVKVEEVNRYPNAKQKVFTWETDKAISYVTFEKSSVNLPLGTRARVLVQK